MKVFVHFFTGEDALLYAVITLLVSLWYMFRVTRRISGTFPLSDFSSTR